MREAGGGEGGREAGRWEGIARKGQRNSMRGPVFLMNGNHEIGVWPFGCGRALVGGKMAAMAMRVVRKRVHTHICINI